MCGIAGIFHLDGCPCDAMDVQRITDALAHRGPDGSGIHTDGSVGLGHRRLAILDLSEGGKQPMSLLDGRYWITFNGEVFNFLELRKQLERLGQNISLRDRHGSDRRCLPSLGGGLCSEVQRDVGVRHLGFAAP